MPCGPGCTGVRRCGRICSEGNSRAPHRSQSCVASPPSASKAGRRSSVKRRPSRTIPLRDDCAARNGGSGSRRRQSRSTTSSRANRTACVADSLTRKCNFTFALEVRLFSSAPSRLGASAKRAPPDPLSAGQPAIEGPARTTEVLVMKSSRTVRILCAAAVMLGCGTVIAQTSPSAAVKNVVLVHGGFVDGSGWEGVYKILKKDGYTVAIVQNPTISLADDVAVTKRTIANQNGPVILVGHSYGGAVITEAGNDPKVVGLVYVAAFAPDKGESVSTLIANPPPGAPQPPILPPQDGYLFLDKAKFPASFAGDVKPDAAAFMADSQVPWGVEALNGKISEPAWKTKPNWYLVTTEDKMIPPDAQRAMSKRAGATVVEVKGSHAIYVSQPRAVADLIEQAATKVKAASA